MANAQINTFGIDKNGNLVNFLCKTGTSIECLTHMHMCMLFKCREGNVTELTTELGTNKYASCCDENKETFKQ